MRKGNPDQIPIQPVECPVICSPYSEPSAYWHYDKETGEATKMPTRRPAGYYYKTEAVGTGQRMLGFLEDFDELTLVNRLREDVKRWRDSGYRGASNVTRELLNHWTRGQLQWPLFFCQREAVENGTYHRPTPACLGTPLEVSCAQGIAPRQGVSMPRKSSSTKAKPKKDITDYRHDSAKRKNNPPAKIAAEGTVPALPKSQYHYSPRRPPVLRFDVEGKPDALPELLQQAQQRPLTEEEARLLGEALRDRQPWLEWAGKQEEHDRGGFEVDPVALHIHERVSAQAILRVAARQDVQRDLFADPQQEYNEAVQFYRHDIDWTNRLILGDSLQVMSSLARREDLAGKVQMIYIDPPYGIRFASNFQPLINMKVVNDTEANLTREPEMIRAYRDTWHLGTHSYLTYLYDRLMIAKELLSDSGSIFLQISDENLHRVRMVLDEVFGSDNFIVQFSITKKGSQTGDFVPPINEYVLWYCRNRSQALDTFRRLYRYRDADTAEGFSHAELHNGNVLSASEVFAQALSATEYRLFGSNALFSQKPGPNGPVQLRGSSYPSGGNSWKISPKRLPQLELADRLLFTDNRVRYKRFADDFPAVALSNVWNDLAGTVDKRYVVQTNATIVERCMLMTTEPGDLVLDPTCGSGTTAYVAEQWGRRWITIDTSRVAIAIARQRLLTTKFDYYKTKGNGESKSNPDNGFIYKTVPHVTLKSIAQNTNLDPIFAKHEPILEEKLAACNAALKEVTRDIRAKLQAKLVEKQRREGKRAITDADHRRWNLPPAPQKNIPLAPFKGGKEESRRTQSSKGRSNKDASASPPSRVRRTICMWLVKPCFLGRS